MQYMHCIPIKSIEFRGVNEWRRRTESAGGLNASLSSSPEKIIHLSFGGIGFTAFL